MNFIFAASIAFLITYVATPLVIRLAKKWHLVDDPRYRQHPARTHRGIIPRAGGIAIWFGVMVGMWLFLPQHPVILALLLAATITVLIGIVDDYRDVSPYIRFFINIATAAIVVFSGVTIPYITNPFGGVIHFDTIQWIIPGLGISVPIVAQLLALMWIVWTMNIVGWSAGIDGQMPGFVVIAAAVLGIISLQFSHQDLSQTTVATLAFVTMGAFLGFLPWNFYPQKIMPGYGGKTLAGLLLATIAILSSGKVGSALLLLAIPMIDAAFLLLRRITAKKSPFRADRNHLHHYLLAIGWSKPKIALFYWSVSFILGIVALTVSSKQKLFIFLMVAVIIGALLYLLSQLLYQQKTEEI